MISQRSSASSVRSSVTKFVKSRVAATPKDVVALVKRSKRLRSTAKDLVYSAPARDLTRRVLAEAPQDVFDYIEEKGASGLVRRMMSETLPPGHFYAKLTLRGWQDHLLDGPVARALSQYADAQHDTQKARLWYNKSIAALKDSPYKWEYEATLAFGKSKSFE